MDVEKIVTVNVYLSPDEYFIAHPYTYTSVGRINMEVRYLRFDPDEDYVKVTGPKVFKNGRRTDSSREEYIRTNEVPQTILDAITKVGV